jgi:predicted dehydrogenase
MSERKLRVGIAGLGLIARTHATAYADLGDKVELATVCDVNSRAASAFADEFGARATTDLDAMLADPGIDIVDLILPHFLHYEAAVKALSAGKHLLLEKPVAPVYADAVAIYRLAARKAAEAGTRFMVAENTRYMAAYQAAARLIAAGEIGDVLHVRTELRSNEKAHLSQPDNWRTKFDLGGGLVLDTGAHSFYLISWLLGEFESLRAVGKKLFNLPNEIEDTAEVTGSLKSGAHFSSTFTSISEIPHSERLELYGTKGGLLIDQMSDPVVKLFRGRDDFAGQAVDGVPFGPDAWHPGGWHFESVLTEVKDYIGALVEGRDPLIDSRDTVYALRVVAAAYESIRSGEQVISLADVDRAQIDGATSGITGG